MSASSANQSMSAGEKSPLLNVAPTANPGVPKVPGRVTHVKGHSPQNIAHRGFSAILPENSLAAFKAAADAGADAFETDLHLTSDNVIVLSHDHSLQRCFGVKSKVSDLTWNEISQLWTTQEPRQRMMRFTDLLEFLDTEDHEHIWLMLDIKTQDDAETMMRRISETLAATPAKLRPWPTRITPCCWDANYVRLSLEYLPEYPPTHLGFSTSYARCLTDVPNISFSLLRHAIAAPMGGSFLREMKSMDIPVYVWTLNDLPWMHWAIRKGVAGVITDDVDLFNEVRDGPLAVDNKRLLQRQREEPTGIKSWFIYRTLKFWGEMILVHLMITMYMTTQWVKHGSASYRVKKALNR